MTELRKQANRMQFGVAEEEAQFAGSTKGLGLIGQETGKVRAAAVDNRTKLAPKKASGTSTVAASGFTTNLSFTPVQGLELSNPEAAGQKVSEANNKYFSAMASFMKVKQANGSQPPSSG